MHKFTINVAALTALAFAGTAVQAEDRVLNVASGGSENMVEYVTDYLGPLFEEQNPGVKVKVIGTGPGDAGSQKILEKLEAQRAAGDEEWDIDVVVGNQLKVAEMVEDGLLASYRDNIETGKMVTRDTADSALGVDVSGYVMPMFHSQTALAYNSDLIQDPPSSYDELKSWTEKHPGLFGYNGIKNGMSGLAFVVGWVYAYGGDPAVLQSGPYDQGVASSWSGALGDLKSFNENITFTPGNAGTLDMLNRGEIVMGPVWVDMFYTWQADGRIPPSLKLQLLSPGMPGQPYYYAVPEKAQDADLAQKFIELATSPAVQAEGIVNRFNWYPGIDAKHVKDSLDPAVWEKLFSDVTPDELAANGKPFPIAPYFTDIKEAYEQQVSN
ncbi:extracellular solute-binding protein [Ruegeria lacuscaerulensis]|uniref:ABC transporter substrate-binding protein n=1 Tax=Ruegeria lacuscaerulensis TaxID=55218 RepID=UPI001BE466F7|nr:extracellular solute-binding protein [Ruegeria lacuscaerulensis]